MAAKRKTKLPGVADVASDQAAEAGALAEVDGEEAEVLPSDHPVEDAPAVDLDQGGADPSEEVAVAGTAAPARPIPAVDDRVHYTEVRGDAMLDTVGRVLHVEGELLTIDVPAAPGWPARVVIAKRYDLATRIGWWV